MVHTLPALRAIAMPCLSDGGQRLEFTHLETKMHTVSSHAFPCLIDKASDRGHAVATLSMLAATAAVALFCSGPAIGADPDLLRPSPLAGRNDAFRLLKTIPVPGAALRAFDISWIDSATQRYYLADRSNKAIDVVDARTGTFLRQISAGFAGVQFNPTTGAANNDTSGPNGVVSSGNWLFVTDAPSRVVSIDLRTDQIISSVATSTSANRADELAYDPQDGVLLVLNNADDPPFATLISVDKSTGTLTVGARIVLDQAHAGFDATNGAEQPVWNRAAGAFYLSIPEVNCTTGAQCGGADPNGGVARILPTSTGTVDKLFPVKYCQPAGLTLGPGNELLLGCSVVFDTAGAAWSATGSTTAAPISVIMNADTGSIRRMVAGVSGSDEVWFNSGDGRYYLAARNNAGGPVLGVIDALTQSLVQVVPTINTAGKANTYPAGTSHSLAVNRHNNLAFVPLPANTAFPDCLNGCIGVFGATQHLLFDD